MSSWITYDPEAGLPGLYAATDGPGCYVIFMDGEVAYVGESRNVAARLEQHNIVYPCPHGDVYTPWGRCKRCAVKVRPTKKYGDWAMVELRLIRRLKPKFNVRHTGRKNKPRKAVTR